MVAYLVISVVTGLGFAAVGLLGFGAGFWATVLWYVAGCWVGLVASIGVFLFVRAGQNPSVPRWPDQPAVR
jgi:hypothetical protein